MERVVIFANGEWQDGEAVQAVLAEEAETIAADGGAEQAYRLHRRISLLIGDMDSVSPETYAMLEAQGCEMVRFPRDKDETDLELALLEAAQRGAHWIRILGALGYRLDQTLANIYLLNLPRLLGRDVCIVAGNQTIRILTSGEHAINGEMGDTVSLIPLDGQVEGISTEGLKYPLQGETLAFGPARGVSNVIISAQPRLWVKSGRLLLVHTKGRA